LSNQRVVQILLNSILVRSIFRVPLNTNQPMIGMFDPFK